MYITLFHWNFGVFPTQIAPIPAVSFQWGSNCPWTMTSVGDWISSTSPRRKHSLRMIGKAERSKLTWPTNKPKSLNSFYICIWTFVKRRSSASCRSCARISRVCLFTSTVKWFWTLLDRIKSQLSLVTQVVAK